MTKRKAKKEKRLKAIENDPFLKGLKSPWKNIMAFLLYRKFELALVFGFILLTVIIVTLCYWFAFNLSFETNNIKSTPQNIKDVKEAFQD